MTNTYLFPINTKCKYNFILENNFNYFFLKKELDLLLEWKNNINLDYYNNILWINIQEEDLSSKDDSYSEKEEILDLFETIDVDSIDERLEEYKGKKDLKKIISIIIYLQKSNIEEIIYIIKIILDNNFLIKDLSFFDKQINKNFKYILKEYSTIAENIQSDLDIKDLILDFEETHNPKIGDEIKSIFIKNFIELEEQINWTNCEKDGILKQVYLAQQWDKKALDYIVWEVIYNEAIKIAKKFAFKVANKDQDEKKQLYNDLLQEAILSSMTWLKKFDINKNDNFIFYIRFWIKQWIHKWLENQYNEIKIPSYIIQLFSKIKNLATKGSDIEQTDIDIIVNSLLKENKEKIDKKIKGLKKDLKNTTWLDQAKIKKEIEILKEIKNDKEYKEKLYKKVQNTIEKINTNSVYSIWSLLKNLEDDEGSWVETNILIDENADIEKTLRNKEKSEELKTLIDATLTEEEKQVLLHHYWAFWYDKLLLDTQWKAINKSAERVRQLLERTYEKLSIKDFDKVVATLNKNKKILSKKWNI